MQNLDRKGGCGIFYISHPQFFVMEENEMFPCDKCNGEGRFLVPGEKIDNETYMAVFKICDKCRGEGKLDWVEMAMGKKKVDSVMKKVYEDLNSCLDDIMDIEEEYIKEVENNYASQIPTKVKKR